VGLRKRHVDVSGSRFRASSAIMGDSEMLGPSFVADRLSERQAPRLHQGDEQRRDTQIPSTAPLISVLADIIMATCVSIQPIVSRELRRSNDVPSSE
jgi:hypothetical protein